MDFAAPHTGFVVAAYAITLAALAVLIVVTVARDRRLAREANRLDMRRRGGEHQ